MTEKKIEPKKISMTNTKQEMLDTYNSLLKELEEKSRNALKPEKTIEDKKMKKSVDVADSLASEGALEGVSSLKLEIGKMLTQIADRLEEEVSKFKEIQAAIQIKESELSDVYEIQKSAATLAALIESQNRKRQEFESEMGARKEKLDLEIQTMMAQREKEKKDCEGEEKEREAAEKKKREREKEEYHYTFKREQQLARDKFEDEKAKLEKAIQFNREHMEKEMADREKKVVEREEELNDLRKKASAFPKEMETAVNKTIKETTEKIGQDAKNKEELSKKEFDGERNVLTTRIGALEKTAIEQSEQITKLSHQLEKAYEKVQDIALKTVEGSSNLKSLVSLEQLLTEQARKSPQDK